MGEPGYGYTQSLVPEYIGYAAVSSRTETSQQGEEEKVNNDSESSGERNWKSPNLLSFCLVIYYRTNKLTDEYLNRGCEDQIIMPEH